MAKFFTKLKNLFLNIWFARRNHKIRKINKKLKTVVVDQEKDRKEFLYELRFYLRKYLKKDASGKYIPLRGKNRAEIYEAVMFKYGKQMAQLNIRFSKNLQIKL